MRERGEKTPGAPILRSQDNPLFLSRLNYGTALGLDPNKVGAKIDSSWATNLKYGPKGKNGS